MLTNEQVILKQKINVMLRMLQEECVKYVPLEPAGVRKNIDREVCRGKIQVLHHVLELLDQESDNNTISEK